MKRPDWIALLDRLGWKPERRKSQNFLVEERVARAIAEALPEATRSVIEIGAGPGILTRELCRRFETVLALDIDSRSEKALSQVAPSATFLQADVLKVDLSRLVESCPAPVSIASNLPFHITGPVLEKIVEVRRHVLAAVVMVQAEVAERIVAPVGKAEHRRLSVALQALFEVTKVLQVDRRCFFPAPEVDSTVLLLRPRDLGEREALAPALLELLDAAFRSPRKTLLNNLGVAQEERKARWRETIAALGLAEDVRPHQVPEEGWWRLAAEFAHG